MDFDISFEFVQRACACAECDAEVCVGFLKLGDFGVVVAHAVNASVRDGGVEDSRVDVRVFTLECLVAFAL